MQAASSTNVFECPICYERYNDSRQLPKSLPCGHSCCLHCTSVVFGRNNSITCPICRKVSPAPPTSLPTNYSILEALPSSSAQPRINMCSKHNNKNLDIFCSNCRICVCSSCFFKDHKGHDGMDIPADTLNEIQSSSTLLSRLDDVCGEITLAVNQLSEVEVELQRKEVDIAASIDESFNQIHAALDAQKATLLSSLPSKRLAVTSHKHQLESFLTDVQTGTQSFRDLPHLSDVVQFSSSREPFVASLSRLDEQSKSTDLSLKHDSNLSLICDNTAMIRSINQFGQIFSKPCQNELECRKIVVDILKQTRGILKWNLPDAYGNQFNWSEELPLGWWNGYSPGWFPAPGRFQVDVNGMIAGLYLNSLGMEGMLPEPIGNLTSLIHLSVGGNQLTDIPDSIGSLSSLTMLNISQNQLMRLPDSISKLRLLGQLYVSNNPVVSTQEGKDIVKRRFEMARLTIHV